MVGVPIQVTQQHRFVAGVLPDDADIEFACQLLGLLPSSIVLLNLIEVEQHGPVRELRTTVAAAIHLLTSTPKSGDGITSAGAQVHDFEVNGMSGRLQKIVEQLPVGLL